MGILLSEIKANPDNPRVIRDERFEKLCKSIKDFPKMMSLRPIVVDDNNVVLGGNMRLRALQVLKFKEIPDEWVKMASELTEEEKKRFIIADNVGFGDWDNDMLANEFEREQLEDWGIELPVFETEIEEIKDDEFIPKENIETDIQEGDIFKIGNHYLSCGDYNNSDLINKLLNVRKAQIILTDPPYEIDFNYSNAVNFTENAHIFIFNNDRAIIRQLDKSPFEFKKFFVFNHSGCAIPQEGGNECFLDHILISHEVNGKPNVRFNKGEGLRTVIRGEYRKSKLHKHEKPFELLASLIKGYSNEMDIVLDFFGGSGSLMSVCQQLNRVCCMTEIDNKNCQTIIDRMKKCYNLEAVKIN